jgi:hypothetical protein
MARYVAYLTWYIGRGKAKPQERTETDFERRETLLPRLDVRRIEADVIVDHCGGDGEGKRQSGKVSVSVRVRCLKMVSNR